MYVTYTYTIHKKKGISNEYPYYEIGAKGGSPSCGSVLISFGKGKCRNS